MKKINTIISDLDGTLFYDGTKNNPELTQENINAIYAWINQGKRFIIASGRTGVIVDEFKEKYNLDVDMIACNGGKIIINHQTVYQSPIAKETILKLESLLRPYQEELDFMLDMENPYKVAFLPNDLINTVYNPHHDPVYSIEDYFKDENAMLPCKIFMPIHRAEKMPFFYQMLCEEFKDQLKITRSSSTTLELCNANISKGASLLKLIELLKLDLDEIIVVGDEENDIELFTTSKHSAVMAQAKEKIKAYADEETPSVAALIYKYL